MAIEVSELQEAVDSVSAWCKRATPTDACDAISDFVDLLAEYFRPLGGNQERVSLPSWKQLDAKGQEIITPLGPALVITQRPLAKRRIFFCIHTDVVYGPRDLPGPISVHREGDWLHAPGSVDAKGGIWILARALRELEENRKGEDFGWTIVLNSDEEVGSPGSRNVLIQAAAGHACAFLFEPALPGGHLAGARSGSGNFTAVMRGRGGHAGRDAMTGRNALLAISKLAVALEDWTTRRGGVFTNLAAIEGGGPFNRIPDLGLGRFNFRLATPEDQQALEAFLKNTEEDWSTREGLALTWQGEFSSPPKPAEGKTAQLLTWAQEEAAAIGMGIRAVDTGGVCDGNRLAAAGIPNVDTLGAVGSGIHGAGEKLWIPSLLERARLTTALVQRVLREDFV
jgi:glutamate carboxypeptidase